jgi:hypothetical protein
MAETVKAVQLKPETLDAFEAYVRQAEAEMQPTLTGTGTFLWSDPAPERAKQVREGKIVAETWLGKGPVQVPDGLVHDLIGAAFAPGAVIRDAVALLQDYDSYPNIYKPEVMQSKVIGRQGDDFQVFLRLLKKKIITVVIDTDHSVHYEALSPTRWTCRSYSTRICEVEDAGKKNEKVLPADAGFGFLWRLYSYWRIEERDGGVYLECRAISLTRDIPKALALIINPIVGKLPRESLANTLKATRQGLALRRAPAPAAV